MNIDVTPNTDLKIQLEAVQKLLAKQEDQLNRLMFMPESNTAAHILQLRKQLDIASLIFSFESSVSHRWTRPQVTQEMLSSGTTRLELELMTDFPSLYPLLMPIDVNAVDLESTGTLAGMSTTHMSQRQRSNPTAFSSVFGSPYSIGASKASTTFPSRSSSLNEVESSVPSIQLGGDLCDKKLHRLQISYWTSVIMEDSFAASAISIYLELEHPLLGFFDVDLFLADLVEKRQRYCSSFMVSALLYHACQLYTAIDKQALVLAREFYAEAIALWESGKLPEDVNTLAGINLLSLGEVSHGRDDRMAELLQASRSLCEQLKICNVPYSQKVRDHHISKSSEWKRAAAHAGWGSHNWLLQQAVYCGGRGIDHPPALPIPGDGAEHASLGGEWAAHVPAKYIGQTFIATTKMWIIAGEVLCVYSDKRYRPFSEKISRTFAEEKFRKILSLLDEIPPDVARNSNSPTSVILLHLLIHARILDIFRPTLIDSSRQELYSFYAENATTRQVFGASVNQIKRLLIICRLRHPRSLYTVYLNSPILQICNAMLHDVEDHDRQFYFRLCLYCVRDLYVCLPVDLSIAQSVLVMAMRRGFISGSEAFEFMTSLRAGQDHLEYVDGVSGRYTVDYNLALTAPREAEARILARAFDDLTLFSELTNERYWDDGPAGNLHSRSTLYTYYQY